MDSKNYYDELEVNKNASKDVIKKVYKLLAKKYHPDTCGDLNKKIAEEKFKKLTEAYETLIDDNKREAYDLQLSQNEVSKDNYNNLLIENEVLKSQLETLKNKLDNLTYRVYSNNFESRYGNNHYNTRTSSSTSTNTNTNTNSNYNYSSATNNKKDEQTYSHYANANSYKSNLNNKHSPIKDRIKNIKEAFIAIILTSIIICTIIYSLPYIAYVEKLIFSTSYIENTFQIKAINTLK